MEETKKKDASASYDAVTRQRSGDMKSKEVPFRHFCNYVKKKLIQYVLDEISTTQSSSTPICADKTVSDSKDEKDHDKSHMEECPMKSDKYGVRVLDLASGRGGDIGKWMYMCSSSQSAQEVQQIAKRKKNDPVHEPEYKHVSETKQFNMENSDKECEQRAKVQRCTSNIKAQMSHYEGYDVSAECIAEARHRFEVMHTSEMSCTAAFTVADCFSAKFLEEELPHHKYYGQFDVVSIQFALHYACSSVDSVQKLINAITHALKPGGYFIATTVHPHVLSERVQRNALSNSLYEITLISAPEWVSSHNTSAPTVNFIENDDTSCSNRQHVNYTENNCVATHETNTDDKTCMLKPCTPYHFKLQGFVDCCEYVVPLTELIEYAENYHQRSIQDEELEELEECENGRMSNCQLHLCKSMSRPFASFLSAYESDWKSNKGNKLSHDERELVTLYMTLCFVKV